MPHKFTVIIFCYRSLFFLIHRRLKDYAQSLLQSDFRKKSFPEAHARDIRAMSMSGMFL